MKSNDGQHPVPVSERLSIVYVDRGTLTRDGHALVLDQGNTSVIVPVGITGLILVGPGVSVAHGAVALCAAEGAVLMWVGENGVRLYAAGDPAQDQASRLR